MLQITGWCLIIAALLIGVNIFILHVVSSIAPVIIFVFFILLASLILSQMH